MAKLYDVWLESKQLGCKQQEEIADAVLNWLERDVTEGQARVWARQAKLAALRVGNWPLSEQWERIAVALEN